MNARLSSHSRPLHEVDPEIARAIDLEVDRQARTLELIASRISSARRCWKPWAPS